jgi:hypothetical protein
VRAPQLAWPAGSTARDVTIGRTSHGGGCCCCCCCCCEPRAVLCAQAASCVRLACRSGVLAYRGGPCVRAGVVHGVPVGVWQVRAEGTRRGTCWQRGARAGCARSLAHARVFFHLRRCVPAGEACVLLLRTGDRGEGREQSDGRPRPAGHGAMPIGGATRDSPPPVSRKLRSAAPSMADSEAAPQRAKLQLNLSAAGPASRLHLPAGPARAPPP